MSLKSLIADIAEQPSYNLLLNERAKIVELKGLTGSSMSVALSVYAEKKQGIHVVVVPTKDEAGYLTNDLEELFGGSNVYFFPSGYKKSIIYQQESATGVVHRTSLLERLSSIKKNESIIICTYPMAIAEKVVAMERLNSHSIKLSVGQVISVSKLEEELSALGFYKTDFVYEPSQYSIRGGIVDIFSYSDSTPYRIDFFGNEIDSIRSFDISTQRSIEKKSEVAVVSNLGTTKTEGLSLFDFIKTTKTGCFTSWVTSPADVVADIGSVYLKMRAKLAESSSALSADGLLASRQAIIDSLLECQLFYNGQSIDALQSKCVIEFNTSPQPSFSKNFDLLGDAINEYTLNGYRCYIVTRNKAQMERLENAFGSSDHRNLYFENIPISLTKGFIDNDRKVMLLTDHQIFERYYRYELKRQFTPSQTMIASELNALSIGDYVIHIDHGIGRYGGILKSTENGKLNEAIKIVYQNGDALLVNVHSLHKISKYKDKDSAPPKINKLGSSTWQKFKASAKQKVKDIAKDLIALYGERRRVKGFAFSSDTYMQYELESSFIYEDTPDQHKATQDFKADMESEIPMDRLICGDVGFGKTEIAIRAAFKAVCDGKQVAILVPTTLLSLQHYRTFSRRLKDFPVTVEYFSRARSTKDIREIETKLREGKVDILVGTHKLLGKGVEFKDLGLLIVDEEQKFGVANKEKLRKIKANVDTLTLTATPIPRTLQFSLMGIRDLSIINTPPPNRIPVSTHVHGFSTELIKEAIDFELERGGQVFVIHNKVKTIEHIASIVRNLRPDARAVVAHGQMKPAELEKIMMDFVYGEYDILIATVIIESGIDIPNVNTIIINDAQNFGLSTLHQLRGRVGRTNRKAYCYLLTPDDLLLNENARLRLRAIEDFSDLGAGFNISMQDLDIRGAGNILGGEQSGFISDIGFEAYNKILSEAMMELHEEQMREIQDGVENVELVVSEPVNYISDCQVDTDSEAVIPDSYISNVNEKIKLYRQIDKLSSLDEVVPIKESLVDRFGEIPKVTLNLLDIVLLRKKCVELGFEKAIVKNGYLILHFIYNHKSPYYSSGTYKSILEFLATAPSNFKIKTRNDKFLLSISEIKGISSALSTINDISLFVNKK